jgi:hypothetical protein
MIFINLIFMNDKCQIGTAAAVVFHPLKQQTVERWNKNVER